MACSLNSRFIGDLEHDVLAEVTTKIPRTRIDNKKPGGIDRMTEGEGIPYYLYVNELEDYPDNHTNKHTDFASYTNPFHALYKGSKRLTFADLPVIRKKFCLPVIKRKLKPKMLLQIIKQKNMRSEVQPVKCPYCINTFKTEDSLKCHIIVVQ